MMEMFEVDCPVCSNWEHNVLFEDCNRRDSIECSGTYVQCKECSLVYLKERPPWEEIIKFYSAVDSGITAAAGQIDPERLRQQVERPVPKWKRLLRRVRFRPHSWPLESVPLGSKSLLDLGCGNGAKLFELAQRGYDVWGLDVGADAIKVCQELLPQGHFIQGELPETGVPDAYFDYIRIDNALEHVPNPKQVIRECWRLLHEGGQLLVYVPHGRSLSMRIMKGNCISSWIPFHLQLFTKKSLTRLLAEAGLKDIRVYGYYPNSWLPLSIMQWKARKRRHLELTPPSWLCFVCYPLGWMFSRIGWAEELVGTGIKAI